MISFPSDKRTIKNRDRLVSATLPTDRIDQDETAGVAMRLTMQFVLKAIYGFRHGINNHSHIGNTAIPRWGYGR